MPTFDRVEVEVEFEVRCEKCGADLVVCTDARTPGGRAVVAVYPCINCLAAAREEAREAAKNEFEEEARRAGL